MPILLKDTLATPSHTAPEQVPGSNFTTLDGETRNTVGMTPYRVLQKLGPEASEDQKDSAIQANFKPGAIPYNTRTDTMTTFGFKLKKVKPFEKTQFMDTTYFHGGKYFHPERGVPTVGVAGDPAPYLLRNDNTITSLLLGCFLLSMVSLSFSKELFFQQLKNFFFVPRSVAEMTETALERRFQWFFILQTAMLLGIIYYVYQALFLQTHFNIESQLALIGIFSACFTLYLGAKYWIYKFVNWVFFHSQKNELRPSFAIRLRVHHFHYHLDEDTHLLQELHHLFQPINHPSANYFVLLCARIDASCGIVGHSGNDRKLFECKFLRQR